ncbi:hypothetical protein BJX70DRAFT_363902 [Aspergillus crustosus]
MFYQLTKSRHVPQIPVPGLYTRRLLLTFLFIYLVLIFVARYTSSRDPTSVFFQPSKGYEPIYSTLRTTQAAKYIQDTENNEHGPWEWRSSPTPSICIGVATVARKNARYFKTMVGSLIEGLSEAERADMHLILFIAHTDPSVHPAYAEPWLQRVADQVLLYDEATVNISHIHNLETGEERLSAREKALFDYTYLLRACEGVGAEHVAMLEDDVLAMDGWYHRTRQALASIKQQMAEKREPKWLYLRLFYTERFLGWNAEEWPTYLFYSLFAVTSITSILLLTRHYLPKTRPFLQNDTIFALCAFCTPALIILFFAAGRVTMLPIPTGVNEMAKFGCCSQGFVFPQSRVSDLVALYEKERVGYVDMLTERYANEHDETRWAVTPSVMQHVGRLSSKEALNQGGQKSSVAELWNFGFELNEAGALRQEHDIVNVAVSGG